MADNRVKRPRTEIIIAIAATIVSVCAMVTTVYQTYILRQQQHAAVWPRLQLAHGYFVESDEPFYRLFLLNNGIGPAIIRKVSINYQDSSFRNTASLAKFVAEQNGLPDTATYQNYSDLIPDMVIPQQEPQELLLIRHPAYVSSFVKATKGENSIQMTIQYESLYGETWEVSYPGFEHHRVD